MRNVTVILLCVLATVCFARRTAKKESVITPAPQVLRVLTAIPALESLAKEITNGTPIEILNPFGNEFVIEELSEIHTQFEHLLDTLAPTASAVITMRSVINSDELFINIRHRNIRAIEIDCVTPVSPVLTAVGKVKNDSGEVLPYAWLSLSNAIRMAEVVESDFSKLFPEYSKEFSNNLIDFKVRANELRNKYTSKLLVSDDFNAICLTHDFDYLLKDIDLFVMEYFPPEYEWNAEMTERFSNALSTQSVGLVINRWETGSPASEIMENNSVNNAVLTTGFPASDEFASGFLVFWQKNIEKIIAAMSKN